jgi:alanine racemase
MPPSENVPSPGLVSIDLDALARNFETLRRAAEPGRCAAVVKADAYGLGMAPVAATLYVEGCRDFFVANVTEGEQLRAQLANARVYVLAGIEPGTAARVRAAQLAPVLNSLPQAHEWIDAGASSDDTVIIQIDTGMSRLGMSQTEVEQLAADAGLLARLDIAYIATHFACADEPEHPLNAEQLERFDALRSLLPACPICIDNSASVLADRRASGDLVRPGIALYGGNPFVDRANPMETVVAVASPVLQVRDVVEPVSVGYGATHEVTPPARLATIGVGYADGYPRALGNRARVSVAGHDSPVVGRVSMDLTTIDVTGLPDALVAPGTLVELIGKHVSLDDVAAAANTISYEILTGLGVRWQRRYVGARAAQLGMNQ